MKEFLEPVVEFIEVEYIDTTDESGPCDYACPAMYGNACEVKHEYNGEG